MSSDGWTAVARLEPILDRARAVGFLGPGPVGDHLEHARRFHEALGRLTDPEDLGGSPASVGSATPDGPPIPLADLGSGGGVPGLPLFVADPRRSGVLIDASTKRCSFLAWAVAELGLADRVSVWCGRAEELGHQERARGRFAAVVARGFGPPARTVECAAPLLVHGGSLVISEPPVARDWPTDGLARVGLVQRRSSSTVAVFQRTGPVDDRFPRVAKQAQREPLFDLD